METMYATPSIELRFHVQIDITFLLLRVGPNPSGFGVLSGGTFIGFFYFKKVFEIFEKFDFKN